jgi:hypothetical protein
MVGLFFLTVSGLAIYKFIMIDKISVFSVAGLSEFAVYLVFLIITLGILRKAYVLYRKSLKY